MGNLEEFNKKQEQERKKKRRKKEFIIFLIIIITIAGLYASTVIVKKINVSKLSNEYCEYNGDHPIQTGTKGQIYSTCRGCSKIMEFDYKITDELCETCAKELHRCKQCGNLLQD